MALNAEEEERLAGCPDHEKCNERVTYQSVSSAVAWNKERGSRPDFTEAIVVTQRNCDMFQIRTSIHPGLSNYT